MRKDILIELIELLYHFDNGIEDNRTYKLKDFIGFLNTSVSQENIPLRNIDGDENLHVQHIREESGSDSAILITLMFRYAKIYIKKALQESQIKGSDEFAFLITLMTHKSLTKTELIGKQVMEKTSGIDIIRRLIAQGMVSEFADDQDKRSVRVMITAQGRKELEKVLPEMAKVSRIIVGNLTKAEINTLSYLLKKLDIFHNSIFTSKNVLDLDQILNDLHVD